MDSVAQAMVKISLPIGHGSARDQWLKWITSMRKYRHPAVAEFDKTVSSLRTLVNSSLIQNV